MRLGVTHKLFLAILAAAGLAVICSALIMQWRPNRGFHNYLNSIEKAGISRLAAPLGQGYVTEHGWRALARGRARRWQRASALAPPAPGGDREDSCQVPRGAGATDKLS